MNFETFLQNSLSDSEKKVMELLMENFRQQSFFGTPWAKPKNPGKGGQKILYKSGDLQDGFHSSVQGESIRITNSYPYASIHNEGGDITVSAQMKKFFWAMYYKASGGMGKTKTGTPGNNKRNRDLSSEAGYWKSLALMKAGAKIHIPQRQFIGEHPQLDAAIEKVIDRNMKDLANEITKMIQQRHQQ